MKIPKVDDVKKHKDLINHDEEYEDLKVGDMFSVKRPAGPSLRKGQIVTITGFGDSMAGRKIFLGRIENPYMLRMTKAFWNRIEFDNEDLRESNKAKAPNGKFCTGRGAVRWAVQDWADIKKQFISGGYYDPQGRQITECYRADEEIYTSLIIAKEEPCLKCDIRECKQHGLNFKIWLDAPLESAGG